MIHVTPKPRRDGGVKHYIYNSNQRVHDKSHVIRQRDVNIAYKTLYKYLRSNEYVTYEGRGQASRWAQTNAKISSTIVNDLVIIDLSKLWTMRTLTNKHASTMRKSAHRIKVNAFKSTSQTGDKSIAYGR